MIQWLLFLAAEVPVDDVLKSTKPSASSGALKTETMIIFGAIVAVSAILFIWAFFIRQRPTTSRNGGTVLYRSKRVESRDPGERFGSSGRRRRRKRRADHPDNLPRNPTLAEAGGLPPLRPDESDPLEVRQNLRVELGSGHQFVSGQR